MRKYIKQLIDVYEDAINAYKHDVCTYAETLRNYNNNVAEIRTVICHDMALTFKEWEFLIDLETELFERLLDAAPDA